GCPTPPLRREKVLSAKFRACVGARLCHRKSSEISMRNWILPIDQTCEIELRRVSWRIRQNGEYTDECASGHEKEHNELLDLFHSSLPRGKSRHYLLRTSC